MPANIVNELNRLLKELMGRDPGHLDPSTLLSEDLDIDSTELVEICCRLERMFSVKIDSAREKSFKTVGDICGFIAAETAARSVTLSFQHA